MAHIGVQILSREIKRLKDEIHQTRQDARSHPTCAAMLKGRIIGYRRKVRECALVLRSILCTVQGA